MLVVSKALMCIAVSGSMMDNIQARTAFQISIAIKTIPIGHRRQLKDH